MASILLCLNHVPDEQQFAQIEIGGCMKSISVQSEGVAFDTRVGTTRFSVLERMVLRRAHPISMMIGAAGAIWAVAFLWQNNWQWALVAIIGSRLAAYVVLRNANLPAIAETPIGKIALLHLHPINLAVQSVGAVIAVYGLWTHSAEAIMAGLSVVFLGHLFGWSKVDSRFSV